MSTHVKLRRKKYYLNLHIPRHLWDHYGKYKFEQSLQTSDLKLAEIKAAQLAAKYKLEFAAISGNEEAQNETVARAYEEARDLVLNAPLEEAALLASVEEDRVSATLATPADPTSDPSGKPQYTPEQEARIKGLYDGQYLRQNRPPTHREEFEASLAQLTPKWLEMWEHSEERKPSNTLSQYRSSLRLFSEFAGDRKTREITQEDAAEFLDLLRRLPPNHGRGELEGVPIRESVEHSKRPGLSPTTIKRHFGTLKMFWTWAKQNGFAVGDNPFSIKLTKVKKKSYLPWSQEDLTTLLSNPPKRRDAYEGFMIALHSGLRCSEIADLTWSQIKQEAGVTYLQVEDAKTEAGNRRVPLHSSLSWLLDKERGTSTDPIFPKLTPEGARRSRGGDLSKLFGTWKRRQGFTSSRHTFHSTRKNVTQIMEQKRVPENEWARLVGHELAPTFGTYNPTGLTMERMQEIVELIEYPEVDLRAPEDIYGDGLKLSKAQGIASRANEKAG